ncbi:borealin-like isoform X2 [Culicoides brevitarsis]|uniref:borealin-like isoform X2 n=1 Tax=Culicoides brevitarsis TaxID=469753 RepID=UPI00307B8E73
MPRTKVSRKGMAKRNRMSTAEEKLEAKLREYDELVDAFLNDCESEYLTALSEIETIMMGLRTKTPQNILQMKLGELREAEARTFADLNKTGLNKTGANGSSGSTLASLSVIVEEMRKSKRAGGRSHDEEDGTNSNRSSADPAAIVPGSAVAAGRPMGPLASAVAKARRASRSADPPVARTPMIGNHGNSMMGNSMLMSNKAKQRATPLKQTQSQHMSRSKYRTPLQPRPQTVSVDRMIGLITPKVQPNMPLAILRRPKMGEPVFSVTGSPVISSSASEEIANVNIPVPDGVLSIRPTEMNSVDPKLIKKLDENTLEHIKILQQNLNMIMDYAERNQFGKK